MCVQHARDTRSKERSGFFYIGKYMIQFADEAVIEVRSGKGGNGCIAFRREKYVPKGGPAGGDGGKGGDVVFCVKRNLRTLAHLRYKQLFKAKNGCDGEGSNRFGRDGEDVVVPLPPGSIIYDAETGEKIKDFAGMNEHERFVFLTGGKGGWGNARFKSSTNQAPRYAHDGSPGETRRLRVELNIIADAGLVGFPNAGKSSLLDFFTNARPKIAAYPFTTTIPNLGVLRADDGRDIIIADIPGIIEGAADGAGLGIRFLKHISRTLCLLFMIDCSDDSCLTAYDTLCAELKSFSADLLTKPRIILCNKIDVDGAAERAEELTRRLREAEPELTVLAISLHERKGLYAVKQAICSMVRRMDAADEQAAQTPAVSAFMSGRSVCDDMPVQYPGSEPD